MRIVLFFVMVFILSGCTDPKAEKADYVGFEDGEKLAELVIERLRAKHCRRCFGEGVEGKACG